jgi:hypothetical protein
MAGNKQTGMSRRRLLSGAGFAGAGIAAASAGVLPGFEQSALAAGVSAPGQVPGAPADSMHFGRIFPGLPPFAPATGTVRSALLEVGTPGGIIDANDDLPPGPRL